MATTSKERDSTVILKRSLAGTSDRLGSKLTNNYDKALERGSVTREIWPI